jgi:SEC-C motif
MNMQVIVPDIDPLTLASIFPTPGRNDRCHCGSGEKYKRCHEPVDQEAWRAVARLRVEAEAVCVMLLAMPPSIWPEYDP